MSPDIELSLREQFPDLIVSDTQFEVPDSWHEIIATMLLAIREKLDGGHCRIESIYIDEEYGYLRTRLRGEQLPMRTLGRIRAEVLKGRWRAAQTREYMLFKYSAILVPYLYVNIPTKWHIPVRQALEKLMPVVASASNGYRVMSVTALNDHLDVQDNRSAIEASALFLNFVDATFAFADDEITGTLQKLRTASILPLKK